MELYDKQGRLPLPACRSPDPHLLLVLEDGKGEGFEALQRPSCLQDANLRRRVYLVTLSIIYVKVWLMLFDQKAYFNLLDSIRFDSILFYSILFY